MSDRFNNKRRAASGKGQPIPTRTTADNFQLNLKEEDMRGRGSAFRDNEQTTADHYASRQTYYTEKERKKQEREHRRRNRLKSGKNKRVFAVVWLAMVLLISFTIASILITGSNDFFAANRPDGIAEVTMPENVTAEQLAKILTEKGVIDSEMFFKLYCQITAEDKIKDIKPGNYFLETNMDYEFIITMLREGETDRSVVQITFPEGLTVNDVAALLEENEVCKAKDVLDVMETIPFSEYSVIQNMQNADQRYNKLEGYLFPDTYEFYKNDEPETVIRKMISNCETKLSMYQDRIPGTGMTTDEIIILASIIQREAADLNDMYSVSAVLHNRLEGRGAADGVVKLECDSTMFYPYHTRHDLPEGQSDYISRYNTYDFEGLPAGAICNPGIDAIKAAISPSDAHSEYLFFCHSDDGVAYYARTQEEQTQNEIIAGLTDPASADAVENPEGYTEEYVEEYYGEYDEEYYE